MKYTEQKPPCDPRHPKDCPNCHGDGHWWDMVWETYRDCPGFAPDGTRLKSEKGGG